MIENEIQLFHISGISIYLRVIFSCYILMFPNGLKLSAFQILSSVVFQIFGNLEIYFGVSLKIVSDKLLILFVLYYFFVKILTHYKTDLKHAVTMPLHQGYC